MDTEPNAPVTEAELHAWMDGELPEERRGEVERHLAGDPDLARRFDRYRAQRAMLQGTFAPPTHPPGPTTPRTPHPPGPSP
ncbi:anti-sigma factor family protein [Azospirillum argentinense]|uniref:anti-sigma factor family protein n=1 Tax=Azospirillum argentinense TaxID=2970906 RepID=UPI001FFE324C|nr:zf-HC2 domain-containing protein [Azospirillum argentinense]